MPQPEPIDTAAQLFELLAQAYRETRDDDYCGYNLAMQLRARGVTVSLVTRNDSIHRSSSELGHGD